MNVARPDMRDGDPSEKFYILLCNVKGKTRERGLHRVYHSLEKPSTVNVFAGTLLVPVLGKNDLSRSLGHGPKLHLKPFESEGVEVECLLADIKQITYEELLLLAPIPTCQDRLNVYLDRDGRTSWLREGTQIRRGDLVTVRLKGHDEDVLGTVKYKGLLPQECGVTGTHFGVELCYNPGEGSTDGTIQGRRLFDCPPDNGIFVTLNKIRLKNPSMASARAAGYNKAEGGIPILSPRSQSPLRPSEHGFVDCNLSLGDRVVWISDHGPEEGIVKWVGHLPGSRRKELTVGVEFDNPVGSGTGKYRDERLFYARQSHASLMPILGLVKKEDFEAAPEKTQPTVIDTPEDLRAAEQESLLSYQRERGLYAPGVTDGVAEQQFVQLPARPPRSTQSESPNPLYEATLSRKVPVGVSDRQYEEILPPCRPPSMTEKPDPDPDLDVGSMVEVLGNPPVYGLIRWIGTVPDQKDPHKKIAGLEMEEEISAGTDGTFKDIRLFTCPMRRAFFVPLYKCRKDKRFVEQQRFNDYSDSLNFGSFETPDIPGDIDTPSLPDERSFRELCGKCRGIQGHHNSCYLDATLFAMFYFTTVFDSIFYRRRKDSDLPEYEEVQRVLKEGIVNPLRKEHYVRADKVMKLRALLDKLSSVRGLLSEEKDPEEFLNSLLQQIMQADPFLKLKSGSVLSESYYYQLFMEQDENLKLPTTQQLFELSFIQADIKLAEAPSCLILQMPRFGKSYKMFKRIVPSLELDITDVLENTPRECVICGDLAAFECKDCYRLHHTNLNTFCEGCNRTNHKHNSRINHKPKAIQVPPDFKQYLIRQQQQGLETLTMPRQKMELFAVVCIETSHYVSFVKAGSRWIFFDSMADRRGGEQGYNIPEVSEVKDLPVWLSRKQDIENCRDEKNLPEPIRRVVCDAYMCIYQSPDIKMFK